MNVRLEVKGIEGLVANLYASNERVGRHIRAVNRRAARQIEQLAKDFAPVDTGRLKGSITHELSPDDLVFRVYPDPAVFAEDGEPYYAPYVEFGTAISPAQPYLHPAYEALRPHYVGDIRKAVRQAIREAARSAA